jgi:hypothetical protein
MRQDGRQWGPRFDELYDIVKRLIRASHQQVVGPRSDVRRDDLGSGDVRLDAKSSTHDVPASLQAWVDFRLVLEHVQAGSKHCGQAWRKRWKRKGPTCPCRFPARLPDLAR